MTNYTEPEKQIRVGVVGCGVFARNSHIPCLLAHPKVQLLWACDSNVEQLKKIEDTYGVGIYHSDNIHAGLEQIDIALLSLPVGARGQYYEMCAGKKIALYVEKPFARTLREHDEIAGKFQEGHITIGYNRRAYKNTFALKYVYSSGMFGRLAKIAIRQGFYKLSGYSGYRLNTNLAGGGVLIESGIHLIDTVNAIIDATDFNLDDLNMLAFERRDYHTEAYGLIQNRVEEIETVIQVSTLQNFASGIWFEFESCTLHYPMSPELPISIRNKKNKIVGTLNLDIRGASTVNDSLIRTWDECIESFYQGRSLGVSPSNTRLTTKIIEQLYSGLS